MDFVQTPYLPFLRSPIRSQPPKAPSPRHKMDRLQVRNSVLSVTKQKAMEDAKKMQNVIQEECAKAGKDVPPYLLQELIGKGSFGRVYKATDLNSKSIVAVKIIDIEESDTLNPKLADTYSEFMKEIGALKLLSDSGAKNINLILDVLPVGQAMWMVTEYCAGGSVATLMKPTAPGGLQEKWIIPILREVAEAIYWVHKEGIIHRDIKCANVLVTESGAVQLCDFGVAGIIETKLDKRSTFIGTPHWMAPELFDPEPSYSTPVDIWAFGSLVYEIASGLPPNVMLGFNIPQLGSYIKSHAPRLEGDQYSHNLKDLVSFCLIEDPAKRPTIEQVQRHPYIFNTSADYPTSHLANLVKGYKVWEAQGGVRKSLFAPVGALGPSDYSSTAMANDEWNFSTTIDFDRQVMNTDAQAVFDVYGSNVDFDFDQPQTAKPKPRRRLPPQLPAFKAPLEKLFDPNTISNYEENSRAYYGKPPLPPNSDLPLRDDSLHSTLRESLIDLDASLHDGGNLSQFVDMETIKAGLRATSSDSEVDDVTDFNKPPLSDPADGNRRATQDWKFPAMAPPASANPEMSRFPFHEERSGATPNSGPRPALFHHPTEPVSLQSQTYDLMPPASQDNRASVGSLIDLDESLAMPEYPRPSTANSDVGSITGSDIGGANPFDLERHASLYQPTQSMGREPSIYVSDDSDFARLAQMPDEMPPQRHQPGMSGDFFSGSNTLVSHGRTDSYGEDGFSGASDYADPEYLTMGGGRQKASGSSLPQQRGLQQQSQPRTTMAMPPVPGPPSARVMQGLASREEVREDVMRLMASFLEHLNFADAHVSALPARSGPPGE
ncbi:Serine/threonine-protein kinase nak1 [Echria macrotheca]|uniref:non-specific serine/threonine protein kinase n=1 Tax=Echria macrotheca TaxID=438768 RepID=A0AAJ0F8Z5_9PEZI|nr:Serine/threonine-protein kinase nak1 [Echria macrotheca]